MSKAIRVDQEVFDLILSIAHILEREQGRRVSMAEAVQVALELAK